MFLLQDVIDSYKRKMLYMLDLDLLFKNSNLPFSSLKCTFDITYSELSELQYPNDQIY